MQGDPAAAVAFADSVVMAAIIANGGPDAQ